jgi:alkylhydroperoxidase family enzyme
VQAVLDDYSSAPVSNREKALLAFIEKVATESNRVCQRDVDAVKAFGWSDEELYDAITVCALFKFYNTWVDAAGVCDMHLSAYEIGGKRLAVQGYAP